MHPVGREIRLDPEVKVRDDKMAPVLLDKECRAFAKKFEFHSSRRNPFWGW